MSKHMLEIDEDVLLLARLALGTETPAETVNEALRRVNAQHDDDIETRLNLLAGVCTYPEVDAWSPTAA